MAKSKPGIIVISDDTDNVLNWMSDGWYDAKHRGTLKAEETMAKAHAAIVAADDVPDAIEKLKAAGFRVERHEP